MGRHTRRPEAADDWPRTCGPGHNEAAFLVPMPAPRVVLYTKPGCHLCDDMREQLDAALGATATPVHEIDIAGDLDVYMRYRHDIPVLVIDGREVARHRIADAALIRALADAGLR